MPNELIPNLLKKRAYLTPNRVAFIFEEQEVTFLELYEQSQSVAEKMTTIGIKNKDNIGLMLTNHIETIYILFALQLIGCRAILLNNRLTPFEISYQLTDSNAQVLLTEEKYSAIFSELSNECPVVLKNELFNQYTTPFNIEEETCLDEICSIMYTSGTTGNPKGVLQTYGNHWWSATGSAFNLGLNEQDRWICAVPLFHISGYSILIRGVIYGMTVLLHEGFDEEKIIEDIVGGRASIVSVVTTMLSRLLNQLQDKSLPSTFRCMLAGGGPVPKPLLEACVEKNIPVYQTYGMTETASQVVTLAPEDSLIKLGSAGKPLFPVQLKIVTPKGREAKPLEAGEITLKGPNITAGYLNRPTETLEKIKNGWLYTGDIGYLDEDGFLYVLDRRSDLIISGGENIYPAEIEGILLSHDQIIDAGVIGVPDETWGQVPVAVIVPKGEVSEHQLLTFCQQRLAKYKVPKKFIFKDELPRNAAKKLMRHKLKEWWEEQSLEH
ncbi:o-succinylbenzoate--CoA ligase [Bacillus sp. CGMCC 1.16607]|uniref:o-succinylbenzoate--CoA ligase n=1 Tax=Bacillus sp. CGMCC 1.16607 TaxID=3351842 RepID=UPI0036333C9A